MSSSLVLRKACVCFVSFSYPYMLSHRIRIQWRQWRCICTGGESLSSFYFVLLLSLQCPCQQSSREQRAILHTMTAQQKQKHTANSLQPSSHKIDISLELLQATPNGSRHSGVNGFPLQLQLQMRPSLTESYRGILFFNKMALLLPRRHRTLVSTTTTPS